MVSPRKSRDPKTLRPATLLVHGASVRSQFEETSEALFLTQGYLYDTMESAEARFKGDEPGFIYSRFSNPTVAMFEKRMALLEGAEAARATASGMAAVTAALMGQVKAGDHVVAAKALFGSCLYVVEELLPRFGVESTLVEGTDLDAWRAAMRPNTKTAFLESPTNPDAGGHRHRRRRRDRPRGRRDAGGRQCVRDAFAAEAAGARRRLRRLFRHQAHRRAGAHARRRHPGAREFHRRTMSTISCARPARPVAVQRLGDAEVAGDAARARRRADALGRAHRRVSGRPSAASSACSIPAGRTIRNTRSRASRCRAAARWSPSRSTAARKEAFAFANALSIIGISNNLGDAKSLITHPETTTHQRLKPEQRAALGIGPGLLRLSVGLEDVEDLVEDLGRALG